MSSFRYFEFESKYSHLFLGLKKGDVTSTPIQGSFFSEMEEDSICTRIKCLGVSTNPNYIRYSIIHEERKDIHGRYKGIPINYYISIENLDLYKPLDEDTIIVKAGNQQTLENAIRKFSNYNILKVKYQNINLSQFIKSFFSKEVTGSWKKDLQKKGLTSIAFNGPLITDNEIWVALENHGQISCIRFKTNIAGESTTFIINKSGNISTNRTISEDYLLTGIVHIIDELKQYMYPSEC